MKKNSRIHRGFTLIEMIVSIAIFAIVMVSVAAAYVNLMGIDRQTRSMNDLVNNLSFALDTMARTIRTGTNYCTAGCFTSSFSFVDANGCTDVYQLSGTQITETSSGGAGCSSSGALTPSGINVSGLVFNVKGQAVAGGQQPEVIFTVHGTLQAGPSQTETFTIETSATSRSINI